MDWTAIIAASVAAIPGALALIAQVKAQKSASRKVEAEAADVQVGTSLKLLNAMREDIACLKLDTDNLRKRLSRVELENKWLRKGVGVLIHQLECYDIPPEFTLDSLPPAEE